MIFISITLFCDTLVQQSDLSNYFFYSLVDWLIEWCFTPLSTGISAVSRQQITLSMYWAGLWSVLLKDTPTKKHRGSSTARTQDLLITSQTLYHWAMPDPLLLWRKILWEKEKMLVMLSNPAVFEENILYCRNCGMISCSLTLIATCDALV